MTVLLRTRLKPVHPDPGAFGASGRLCIKRLQNTFLLRERADRQVRHRFSARDYTNSYLPCSCDNSPTSSGNLDQSVGSMNPHLPGAQDKISRPSQTVRDWRHEITFSVFDVLLSWQTQRQSGRDEKKWGSFTRRTLPSYPFAAELRHQL